MSKTNAALSMTALAAAVAANPGLYGEKKEGESGANENAELVKSISDLAKDYKKNHGEMTEQLSKLTSGLSDTEKGQKKLKEDVDAALLKNSETLTTLEAKLADLAQKAGRAGGGNDPSPVKSIGQQVVESEAFKGFEGKKGQSARIKIEGSIGLKAITSVPESAGPMIAKDRLDGVVPLARRRMTVRGLLAQGRTTSNAVEFVRELVVTNNAAVQATEGTSKAESDITYELQDAKVATIAHWIKVSKQAMDDAAGLASQIDSRLRYGLAFREELQLLLGSGSGGNIRGLVTAATAFSTPIAAGGVTAPNAMDVLRVAALQASVAEYVASGFVLNPIDWTKIELTKDGQNRYIIGYPAGELGPTLWGLPVVATNSMTANSYLTGAFDQAAQIFDREDPEVLLSTEDGSNFIQNMVTVLAEERLALAIYRGSALITGTLSGGITALTT
ncbi:phage major capsid protein [Hyphomonas sp.]|uniref:phage major capsid protein n=1 Tax=Hyphomonas sp. TaxID=87 RepID=UPI00391B78A8